MKQAVSFPQPVDAAEQPMPFFFLFQLSPVP